VIQEKTLCLICQEDILAEPAFEQENGRILDCSHIFHRECIGEWLKYKHNCPTCRKPVNGVTTPEARRPEMTIEEVLAVPDHRPLAAPLTNEEAFILLAALLAIPVHDREELMANVRQNILGARQVRRVDLNANNPVSQNATRVNSLAGRFFGFQ